MLFLMGRMQYSWSLMRIDIGGILSSNSPKPKRASPPPEHRRWNRCAKSWT